MSSQKRKATTEPSAPEKRQKVVVGYVSKKKREEMKKKSAEMNTPITAPCPDTINKAIPSFIWKQWIKTCNEPIVNQIPRGKYNSLMAHEGGVTSGCWSPIYGDCAITSGNDGKCKLWRVFDDEKTLDQLIAEQSELGELLLTHGLGIKSTDWNEHGLLTASWDKSVKFFDVHSKNVIREFNFSEFMTCVKWNPYDTNLFVSGGDHGELTCWDVRVAEPTNKYPSMMGTVQSIQFLQSGKCLAISTDVTRRNAANKALGVLDFESGVVLSNNIYQEGYTCPKLLVHPHQNHFLAQSNANYIAIFKANAPFKLNRKMRFEGHQVGGFSIDMDVSKDGEFLCSGSSGGKLYFYDWKTARVLKTLQTSSQPNTFVKFHPTLPSTLVVGNLDGKLYFFDE